MSFPTPSLSHLRSSDYEKVYEPAEDSFILMDTLEMDLEFLKARRPSFCLEVGSGSGAVITFLATLLPFPTFTWGVDVNTHASLCTLQTLRNNGVVNSDSLTMDLTTNFEQRLTGKLDVLLFNPPYVETPSEEVGSTGLQASWAGGKKGREVIDRFLPCVGTLLSQTGVFYIVLKSINQPGEVCELLERDGLHSELVESRHCGIEKLYTYKFYRPRVS